MKKLIMLTLALVALSGSSLFGARVHTPVPMRQTQPYQTSGTTAFMDPALSDCLQRKGTSQMTQEEAQEALAECQKEISDQGGVSVGDGKDGIYY